MVELEQIRRVGRALLSGGIVLAVGAWIVRLLSGSVTGGGFAMEMTSNLFMWVGVISAVIGLIVVLLVRIRMRSSAPPPPTQRFRPSSAQRRR